MWFWPYALKPRRSLSALAGARPRHGALIRTEGGFADVHPWPELGDATIDEQLARLARNETTPLTAASLRLAQLDAGARERGVSLFAGVTIPESHWPGDDPPHSFDTAKVKSASHLPDRVRLRIDFNAMLTPAEFEAIAKRLPRDRIDFVEDPCPYDAKTWHALRDHTGLRLALDRTVAEEAVDVLVVKPAIQEVPKTSQEKEIVVTSYMDHPVGQLGAAFIAAKHATSPRCGLVTHVLYDGNEFSEQLAIEGMRLVPPAGSGIGFDDALERLPWRRLR
jgi:O-succinylbenzoate synthase